MKRGADAMERGDSARRRGSGDQSHKRMRNANAAPSRDDSAKATVKTLADEKETDPHRLAQRQKQIDYGKNTIGYDRYCADVPRHKRRPGRHPMTPDKTKKVGKKVFDGMVRRWRQALHQYDPPELEEAMKTVETGNAVAGAVEKAGDAAKVETLEQGAVVTKPSMELKKEVETAATSRNAAASIEPTRSIYENFDEDNSDDEDSDDDLL